MKIIYVLKGTIDNKSALESIKKEKNLKEQKKLLRKKRSEAIKKGKQQANALRNKKLKELEKYLMQKALKTTPYRLYFDGCNEPINPCGKAGCGFIIYNNDEIIHEEAIFIADGYMPDGTNTTNNIAEWLGLLYGLDKAIQLGIKTLVVFGDSQMVINQADGKWKCHKEHLLKYLLKSQELKKQFDDIKFFWIPREKNLKADELSKKAIGL